MTDDEWAERLRAAVEKTLARRQRRLDTRREFAERRTAGLRARHQTRLDRIAAADQRLEQARRDGIHDSWYEEDV